jgi:hypothetical protein
MEIFSQIRIALQMENEPLYDVLAAKSAITREIQLSPLSFAPS